MHYIAIGIYASYPIAGAYKIGGSQVSHPYPGGEVYPSVDLQLTGKAKLARVLASRSAGR